MTAFVSVAVRRGDVGLNGMRVMHSYDAEGRDWYDVQKTLPPCATCLIVRNGVICGMESAVAHCFPTPDTQFYFVDTVPEGWSIEAARSMQFLYDADTGVITRVDPSPVWASEFYPEVVV